MTDAPITPTTLKNEMGGPGPTAFLFMIVGVNVMQGTLGVPPSNPADRAESGRTPTGLANQSEMLALDADQMPVPIRASNLRVQYRHRACGRLTPPTFG
ncbi:MAG: hypothetical protein AAF330_06225 [Pseudomonadota bacterium]